MPPLNLLSSMFNLNHHNPRFVKGKVYDEIMVTHDDGSVTWELNDPSVNTLPPREDYTLENIINSGVGIDEVPLIPLVSDL